MIWAIYLLCTTKCHCQWPLRSKLGKHPQQGVSLYAICRISYFPSKASQSSLTSLWFAQMLLNGMPSSKCSQRIVWTIQPWLQCRDHMSKWYLAGTVLTYFLDSHWFWMDIAGQLHWYQLSPFAHAVSCEQVEFLSNISMSWVYDSSSPLSVFILHPDRSRSLDISSPGISK